MSLNKTTPAESNYVNMLVYGAVGSGKTHFCGTAVDHEPAQDVLFVSPDKGEVTIQDKDFDVVRINDFSEMDEIKEYIHAHIYCRKQGDDEKIMEVEEKYFGETPDEVPHYNTICLDSLTELDRYLMYDVVGDDITDSIGSLSRVEIQHYNDEKRKLLALARSFRDFEAHTILTATEQRNKDEMTGEVTIIPKVTSDYGSEVAELMDIVGYSFTKETENGVEYGVMFEGGDKHKCKQRFGLPRTLKNPGFSDIINHVQSTQ